ncbi:peptidoglycan DD-metalloendopeptidase family protein [Cytobacillus horneckiae]|uniref:peptidoglycan DD-metalloendopeptidase family protein n=1 Tax=Cytobacillus horneckiae TaxID=549687 RepID=UPI0020424DD9|nr:peptidoglycan DD-metalloendopeptidase family protein [Cytobacillus horneckiae]MCM3180245.1 peptidoglycan DD-metalloendopeptidase family protein [Cytobacillus horneckiae]
MERIEGLSIGLDLETTALNRGLTGLRDKLRNVNSEMRANLSAFDRGDRSIASYETRLTGLTRKLEVQKEVTKAAKQEYERMVREHGEGSVQADKAARAYNNEVAALNNLERNVERTRDELSRLREAQRIANSGWTRAGEGLTNFGNGLKSVSEKAKNLGSNLTKSITMPALGAATALGGIALVKGFDRLIGIDTARAKLTGLGHDAEGVEKIMESALEAVRGTSFGMDEAATTAANAVAAGVEEGKNLTKYLSLTGDAAAIAGSSMSEMGSIFNKVKTSNKAYNGELQQLSDRGLPVYQWLAKEAGVAAEEVTKMASDGKISSEMLMAAIENNIGGAAQKMGETSFTAGVANMWAAVGRLGASFLDAGGTGGGFFSQLKPLIADFTGRLDSMGDFAAKAGVKFGELFSGFVDKVKSVKAAYDDLSPTVQDIVKKVGLIGTAITVGIGPVLTVLGIFGGLVASLALKIAPLFKKIAEAGGLLKWLKLGFTALTGPVGITIGIITLLTAGFVTLYAKSETFREGVKSLMGSLKDLAAKGLEQLKKAVTVVSDFFKEQLEIIKSFWEENKESIMGALKNIGSFISTVFKGILAVIKFVMPVVLAIIKSVWGNIKGVISGALNIIMGVVKVFSGLFTGDFSKMWEGVKQLFSGALEFIWNFMQLMFWGKMVKGVISLGKLLLNNFKSMWKSISDVFSAVIKWIVDFVKGRFAAMQSTISSITTTIKMVISTIWNGILTFFRTIIKTIVDFIRGRFTAIKDSISGIFTSIRNTTQTVWNAIKDRIINPIKSVVSSTKTRFTDMKNQITGIFNGIRTKIGEIVDKMIDTVKGMPKKMGDGLKKTAGNISSGVKSVANKMTNALGLGVNGVIGGVNWVLDKLDVKTRVKEWTIPQYAHGTKGHPGGLAIVGDGKGNNAGRELITTPDGKSMLSPAKNTLINLPKGSQVLSALDTKSLLGNVPKYAHGTGGLVQSGLKKIKDVALNIWDFASNPSKILDIALETLGISKPDNSNQVGKIARGGFNMVKDNAIGYVKSMFSKAEKEGGGSPGKLSFPGFRFTSPFGQRWGRLHGGVDYAAPIGTPIPSQSNGTVSFASAGWNGGFGNLVKVKQGIYEHFYAHMSRILTSVGQRVSKGSILGLVGNTGDSTGPHVHYELRKNGVRLNPQAFATGGLINNSGLYQLAEEGWPEWVIPTDPKRRTEAMKLLALAGKQIRGNKRPNQLPNTGQQGYQQSEEISLLKEQVRLLTELVVSSRNIERKPVLSEGDIGRANAKYEAGQSSKNNIFKGRVATI